MNWRVRSFMVVAACWLACLGAPVGAQEWADKMFDHKEYDFGSVARGAEAQHRFPIKNLYKEDLQIGSVFSSCGCTKPHVTQQVIKSGETAYVVADFDTRSFQGFHSATITVNFTGQFSGEVRLQVQGTIRKDLVFIPGKIDVGTIDAGTPKEIKVNVAYAGRSDWQIVDVRSANSHFEVELNPKERAGGQIKYELLFRLKPTAPAGYLNDRLTIVTNDAANRQIPLAVEGNVISALTVSPTSLQFGSVQAGGKAKKQLIVKGKNDFHVLRVECDDPAFKCEVSDKAKKLHMIPITYEAGDKAGKVVKRLRVVTDASSGSLPEIVAHVTVQSAAADDAQPVAKKTEEAPKPEVKKADEAPKETPAVVPAVEKPSPPVSDVPPLPETTPPAAETKPAAPETKPDSAETKSDAQEAKPEAGPDEPVNTLRQKTPKTRRSGAWRISTAGPVPNFAA